MDARVPDDNRQQHHRGRGPGHQDWREQARVAPSQKPDNPQREERREEQQVVTTTEALQHERERE